MIKIDHQAYHANSQGVFSMIISPVKLTLSLRGLMMMSIAATDRYLKKSLSQIGAAKRSKHPKTSQNAPQNIQKRSKTSKKAEKHDFSKTSKTAAAAAPPRQRRRRRSGGSHCRAVAAAAAAENEIAICVVAVGNIYV